MMDDSVLIAGQSLIGLGLVHDYFYLNSVAIGQSNTKMHINCNAIIVTT
jgi:hypothetical protein